MATADLEGVLARLTTAKVDFVLIGGYAAVVHGSSLVTGDVDICCNFSPDNLLRLQAALDAIRRVHRQHPRRLPLRLTPDTARGWKNLYLSTDDGQLDCLSHVLAVGDFETVKRESIEIELPSGPCRVLSLEALIRAKEALDRARDRQAAIQLRTIQELLDEEDEECEKNESDEMDDQPPTAETEDDPENGGHDDKASDDRSPP